VVNKQKQEDQMEPNNDNTKKKKFTHLKESERYKIEVYLEDKKSIEEIARKISRARSTIYREVKRGSIMRLQYDLSEKKQYRADVAQRDYRAQAKHKGRDQSRTHHNGQRLTHQNLQIRY